MYIFEKNKNIIKKIIYINKINLPDEIINIIKDLLFVDIKTVFLKKNKKLLNFNIKNIFVYTTLFNDIYDERTKCLSRIIIPNKIVRVIKNELCVKCGEILNSEEDRCNCMILSNI